MCLGLDPGPGPATAVGEQCQGLIEAVGASCVAVKPQLACFERLGPPGWKVLGETIEAAQRAGLLVIADGKRGDVPHTASVYAENLLGAGEAGLRADAATVNPLMGGDVLDAFLDAAEPAGAGLFVLVRTSNPGAADLLDLDVAGAPLFERIAALVAAREERLAGEVGLSGMGAVAGATEPRPLGRLRQLMPRAIFLIPGVGAQGGQAGDLAPAMGPHPASMLVAASRSIAGAADPEQAAEQLRAELWELN